MLHTIRNDVITKSDKTPYKTLRILLVILVNTSYPLKTITKRAYNIKKYEHIARTDYKI